MPGIDFANVKREVSMEDVLRLLNWSPVSIKGSQQRGPCPVHCSANASSRSFCVNGEGWYCHKCKRGGDQLALYSQVTGLPIYDATVALCGQLRRAVYFLPRPRGYEAAWNSEEER
jgi:hypothetical protein